MDTSPGLQPRFYSGLSGLQLPVPQRLYPAPFEKASRLTYYASLFNSIEFNNSFYRIPKAATVAKWAASVPEEFRFTFKLWRGITHNKRLIFNEEEVTAFFNAISEVKNKKGCLLLQFPPSLGREQSDQLGSLLNCINELNTSEGWKVAVEFRNRSWYHEQVYDLLHRHKAALVIHDMPKSATPLVNHSSDLVYIRFHGPTGNYRGSYTDDFLNEYATCINEWIAEGSTVHIYFNNTMGDAFNNLKTLNTCLQPK